MCSMDAYASDHLSKKLSEILDDIGVNERVVMNRRYMSFLAESVQAMIIPLESISLYAFGSSVEGTTTLGLSPDRDVLISDNQVNVTQDRNECKPGAINLLMVHGETPSGYCLLQYLKPDIPINTSYHFSKKGSNKRIFLNNTIFRGNSKTKYFTQNGPALTCSAGFMNQDTVHAVACKSWPQTANYWLRKYNKGGWPTEEMKRYCQSTGCFLVPVASVGSGQNEELEWRISTSLAEQYLMFTLNITQIRCLVLMKTIRTSYLNQNGNCKISSYMCKNVLLHCVENTDKDFWSEDNLINCLTSCFERLRNFVASENCPHFIIRENNLLAGRLSPKTRFALLAKMENLIQSSAVVKVLTTIQTDTLGKRLEIKLNIRNVIKENCLASQEEVEHKIYRVYLIRLANILSSIYRSLYEVEQSFLFKTLFEILKKIKYGNGVYQNACYLIAPFLFTTIGSAIASANINIGTSISKDSLFWFSFGINSDVSSSRLKIASAFYCAGKMYAAHCILRDIESRSASPNVMLLCGCPYNNNRPIGFFRTSRSDEYKCAAAFCVCFFSYEVNCIPQELQYELYRYTNDELFGKKYTNHWNVDSFPYLYFLEYKVYGQLMQRGNQVQALSNLIIELELYPNVGHKETFLNLLGQCLEQEKQDIDALCCYLESYEISKSNDAAKWHICILIAKLVKHKARARNYCGKSLLKIIQEICKKDKKGIQTRMSELYNEIQNFGSIACEKMT